MVLHLRAGNYLWADNFFLADTALVPFSIRRWPEDRLKSRNG